MRQDTAGARPIRFGVFELDVSARELRKGGRRIHLQDKPFDLLAVLVARKGELVSREELRRELWAAETFVQFDDGLNTAVSKIRDALGDRASVPLFIETIPRHGYRFIAPLREDERAPDPPAFGELKAQNRGRPRISLIAALAGSLVLAVMAAGFLGSKLWSVASSVEPLRAVALTTFPGTETYPSLSVDGSAVAFVWNGAKKENFDIYLQIIGSGAPSRLTLDPRAESNPVWSPDGRTIAFLRRLSRSKASQLSRKELLLTAPSGGPERKVAEIQTHDSYIDPVLAWCPDSSCLIVTDSPGDGRPEGLFVVSLETGEKRLLTSPRSPLIADTSPAVSPDGRALVFRRLTTWTSGDLYVLVLAKGVIAGGEPKRLVRATPNARWPAWMPNGEEILFSTEEGLWRMPTSGEGAPARLPFIGEDGIMPVVSRARPGGAARLVYVRDLSDSNIWRIDTAGLGEPATGRPVVAISSTKSDMNAQFSPDGHRVAFRSGRSGTEEIWIADPDGSNPVQLTSMAAPLTGNPQWSPDGELIAFTSNREGQYDVYVVPVAGGTPHNITMHPANDELSSFSRDGKWIYFASNRTGEYQVWKQPVSGGQAVQVTRNGGFAASEGPDGNIYYTDTTGPVPSALWRLPTGGGQPLKVVQGVVRRAFTVLDNGIYYIDRTGDESQLQFFNAGGKSRLQFFSFATGRVTTVADNLGDIQNYITVSPDGRTILYTRVDYQMNLMLVENFR